MGVMRDSVYIASEVLQAKKGCLQLYNAIRQYKTPIVPGVDTFNISRFFARVITFASICRVPHLIEIT